jgi:hypothetical protein
VGGTMRVREGERSWSKELFVALALLFVHHARAHHGAGQEGRRRGVKQRRRRGVARGCTCRLYVSTDETPS